MRELLILHTNDSHGRFESAAADEISLAAAIRALKQEFPEALLLDAGDAVSAGNLGFRPSGEPALEVMSGLGYAAMTLGNRETHPRKEVFPRKLAGARFPLLCANLRPKGAAPNPTRPHVVLTHGNVAVGVFGVSVPMFTRKQWSQPLCDYWFDDPLETARRQAAELRPQVEVLIALTHVGFDRDLELAAACPEVDLVIGGHTHTDLQAPGWAGEVPVVQANSHGSHAGLARLQLHADGVHLTAWEKRPLRA